VSFFTVRPISDRTQFGGVHEYSPFKATWASTLNLLRSELDQLKADKVIIEVDVTDAAIRLDGMLYANAKVASPAVRLAFESKHGWLAYATDRYVGRWAGSPPDWQHNIRAVALGLEALRKVDRYGITKRGEQYAGWKALPAGGMGRAAALGVIFMAAGLDIEPTELDRDPEVLAQAWKAARVNSHPDRVDGDRALWDQVEQAARVLGLVTA
jgi:hypothetical protein